MNLPPLLGYTLFNAMPQTIGGLQSVLDEILQENVAQIQIVLEAHDGGQPASAALKAYAVPATQNADDLAPETS